MNWRLILGLAAALAISLSFNFRQWHAAQVPAPAAATAAATSAPQTSERERVVTQLKCPDGAVITQTTTSAAQASAPTSVTAATQSPNTYDPPRYSIGAEADPRSPRENAEIRVGARLGNLPIRATVGAGLRDGKPAATLGFDVDL